MSPELPSALQYHRWVYGHFKPWIRGRVLEIGAGHGVYTRFLSEDAASVVATDLDLVSLELIRKTADDTKVSFYQLDLLDGERFATDKGMFDAVICLNVLEHVSEHAKAAQNMAQVLSPGGHLVIVVPAFQWLFSRLDEHAGHFRRYTQKTLRSVIEFAGLEVIREQYFNAPGVLGWIIWKGLRPKSITEPSVGFAVRFFDRVVVPVARVTDVLVAHSVGLSLLAVARKRTATISK